MENNSKINIWIDADSCPAQVRNHVIKTGNKNNIPVTLAANKNIPCDKNLDFKMIIVEQEKDSADNYIFENAAENDLVITRDLLFAQRLVCKNIAVINDRGTEFNSTNIKSLLEDREYDMQLAEIGLVKHFNEGYDQKKFAAFSACFNKVLTRLQKN